jgi:Histidine kinase
MTPGQPNLESRGMDLEAWLRPGWRRRLAIAVAVLMAALLTTLQFREFGFRRQETGFPYERLFLDRLIGFSLWAAIAGPAFSTARWLHRLARPVWISPLLQLALGLLVSYGMVLVDNEVWQRVVEPAWEGRGPGRGFSGERSPFGPERFGASEQAASTDFDASNLPARDLALGGASQPAQPGGTEQLKTDSQAPTSASQTQRLAGDQGSENESARSRGGARRGPWERSGSAFLAMRLPREFTAYVAFLGLVAASAAFLERRTAERRSADLALASARLEGELLRARLESVGQRLQPHFLFNALHAVGGLVRAERQEAALGALSDLADLLRLSLEHGAQPAIPLGLELDLIERYLSFEGRRFGERLQVEVDVPAECLSARVPSLVLLPIVENAIKHGVARRPAGGRIVLSAERHGDRLRLLVEESPRAAEAAPQPLDVAAGSSPSLKLGLDLVRERLALLYGKRGHLDVEQPVEGGSRVTLEFDFALAEESDGHG